MRHLRWKRCQYCPSLIHFPRPGHYQHSTHEELMIAQYMLVFRNNLFSVTTKGPEVHYCTIDRHPGRLPIAFQSRQARCNKAC
jgi:hypothetical protein